MAESGGGDDSSWYNTDSSWYNSFMRWTGLGKLTGGGKKGGPSEKPQLAQKLEMIQQGALDLGWASAADGTEETVKKLIEFNLMIGSETKLLAAEKRSVYRVISHQA